MGAQVEHTGTRAAVLASRGYPAEVIAGNGRHDNGDGHQVEELPAVEADHQVVPDTAPALSCALPGCDEPLPLGRRRYCSPGHADEAERRRSKAKAAREAKGRATARRASSPVAKAEPSPMATDDCSRRPGLVEVVAELLASGAAGEVRVELDGAVLVARARR